MMEIRLDKYLWAVRLYKTRSDAADAVRQNRVMVNDAFAKPSREVHTGDLISVRRGPVMYRYRIVGYVASRVGAKLVPDYLQDITPPEELAKLDVPRETVFISRDRGTGRPTKKERRDLEGVMEGMFE